MTDYRVITSKLIDWHVDIIKVEELYHRFKLRPFRRRRKNHHTSNYGLVWDSYKINKTTVLE